MRSTMGQFVTVSNVGALCCAVGAIVAGCSGTVSSSAASKGGKAPSESQPGMVDPKSTSGVATARILSSEYQNSIRDLFPGVVIARDLPVDGAVEAFNSNQSQVTSDSDLLTYQLLADDIATQATANMANLLAPCNVATAGEDECAKQLMERLGKKMYRRPLQDTDRTILYQRIYQAFKPTEGFEVAIQTMLSYLLQSPHFLYHLELVTDDPAKPLSQHAIAARLATFLWRSVADDTLIAAADAGKLSTDAELTVQVDRMLKDEKAKPVLEAFHEQWLAISKLPYASKDAAKYPDWNTSLRDSMLGETRAFVDNVIWSGNGGLKELLSGNFTYADAQMATMYGVAAPAGAGFGRVTFPADSGRSGILTQASFLTANSGPVEGSVVRRGLRVRANVLCQHVPPPPPGTPMGEMISRLQTQPCASCHVLIDNIGKGFDAFDAIGAKLDGATGSTFTMINAAALDGEFESPAALGEALASDPTVTDCYAKQWFRFVTGRLDEDSDNDTIAQAASTLSSSGGVLQMIKQLVLDPGFRSRTPETIPACM